MPGFWQGVFGGKVCILAESKGHGMDSSQKHTVCFSRIKNMEAGRRNYGLYCIIIHDCIGDHSTAEILGSWNSGMDWGEMPILICSFETLDPLVRMLRLEFCEPIFDMIQFVWIELYIPSE